MKNLIALLYYEANKNNWVNFNIIGDHFRNYLLENNYNYIMYKNEIE